MLLAAEFLLFAFKRVLFAPELILLFSQCRETLFDGGHFGLAGIGASVHAASDCGGKLGSEFTLLRADFALPCT